MLFSSLIVTFDGLEDLSLCLLCESATSIVCEVTTNIAKLFITVLQQLDHHVPANHHFHLLVVPLLHKK